MLLVQLTLWDVNHYVTERGVDSSSLLQPGSIPYNVHQWCPCNCYTYIYAMFRVAALARSAVATARFATSSIGMRVAVAHIVWSTISWRLVGTCVNSCVPNYVCHRNPHTDQCCSHAIRSHGRACKGCRAKHCVCICIVYSFTWIP